MEYLIVNGSFVEKSNFIKKLNTAAKHNNFVLEHGKEIVESICMNFEKGKIGLGKLVKIDGIPFLCYKRLY